MSQPSTPRRRGFWSVATHANLAVQGIRDLLVGDRRCATLRRDSAGSGDRRPGAEHDGRSGMADRRLVSSGLTPRMLTRVEDDLRLQARRCWTGSRRDAVRLRGRRGSGTADADDLHPAGSAGVRTPLASRRSSRASTSAAPARRPSPGCPSRRPAADVRLRPGAHHVQTRRAWPTTCSRSSPTRRSTIPKRRRSPTPSCICSSTCCSAGRQDHP